MHTWPDIPSDVIEWFRQLFAEANRRVSEVFLNIPSIRETSLDDLLIETMIPRSAPTRLASGAVVKVDVHNIGGLRRVTRWEVGDIAVLVFVIQRSRIIARKLAILQAKRLYPTVGSVDEEDEVGFRYGMNFFIRKEESPTSMLLSKSYEFDDNSPYGALRADSDQIRVIRHFEEQFGSPIYYIFYNPPAVPLRVTHPLEIYRALAEPPQLGTRVVRASIVHGLLSGWKAGTSPTLGQVQAACRSEDAWPLEIWAADLLLSCREGSRYQSPDEARIRNLVERRSGPIGAAIAVSIELPSIRSRTG